MEGAATPPFYIQTAQGQGILRAKAEQNGERTAMIDVVEYEGLARETRAYKDIEIEILKEAFAGWVNKPDAPYSFLEFRDGRVLAAFAVMCRETGTEYTFTIQTLCVDPSYIGKGIDAKILELIEAEALRLGVCAILRFELSSEKLKAFGEATFEARGYTLVGHIPSFYSPGNDYFMYAKYVHRNMGQSEKGKP
jgi:GNAT superfamily N-acetyltransferase